MPAFVRIELWSKLMCQSGATRLGVLYPDDLASAKDVLAIDDQELLTFSFPRVDDRSDVRQIVDNLKGRTIATVIWDDGSFDERRVAIIDDGLGGDGLITVTANPLILDLGEGADSTDGKGFVSEVSDCLRVFDFTVVSTTADDIWDTYIIPNCPDWVTKGTIDPTATIPQLSWDRLTPQALALQVRDTLRTMNVTCELQLRRNGTTDYKLDLVTQIGADADVPLFHPTTSMQSLKRRVDTQDQATRLFVTGEEDPSGKPGIPGRARWKVSSVNATNKTLTLEDPNGAAGPIGMTDQWKNAYVLRVLTGRTFQIQGSDADDQTVTLLDVSTFASGEFIEFRLTEPGTNTRTTTTRYAISAVTTGALTLSSNPITTNDQYVDWYAKVWTASSGGSVVGTAQRISDSVASTDVITIASSTGFTTSHFVEFVQTDGAGEIPSYLEHATHIQAAPDGYGVKAGDLAVTSVHGVTQLQPNAWTRTWTNSSNPPDGYTIGANLTGSQNTDTDFIRYGPFSYRVVASSTGNAVNAPATRIAWATGNTRVSVRCNVYFSAVSATSTASLKLDIAAPDGTSTATTIASAAASSPPTTGAWTTLEIVGVDLTVGQCPYGVVARLSLSNGALDSLTCYIDTIEIYPFVENPTDVYEYGDATALHQSGNARLLTNGAPLISYELTIHDLERSDPDTWSRNKLTLGGNVRAYEPETGTDTTVRLLRIERDLLRPEQSTVGLASLPAQLTQLVATQ